MSLPFGGMFSSRRSESDEADVAPAGTYTSSSASGDCAYFCATPMITWYWFNSS